MSQFGISSLESSNGRQSSNNGLSFGGSNGVNGNHSTNGDHHANGSSPFTFGDIDPQISPTSIDQNPNLPQISLNLPQILVLNQKLTQLSLNSDSNGNELHALSSGQNSENYDAIVRGILDDFQSHPPPTSANFANYDGVHLWKCDLVESTLRNKLNKIKHHQAEFQANIGHTQNLYSNFFQQCRAQFSSILQDICDDLERKFKNRMLEMSTQYGKVNDLLFQIESKQQEKFGQSLNGDNNKPFIELFDSDFVQLTQTLIEVPIPTFEIRTPQFDPAFMERNLRNLLCALVKLPTIKSTHYSASSNNGFGEQMPYAATPTNETPSNSSDNTSFVGGYPTNGNNFIPPPHQQQPPPFIPPGWQPNPAGPNFMPIPPSASGIHLNGNKSSGFMHQSEQSTFLSDQSNGSRSNGAPPSAYSFIGSTTSTTDESSVFYPNSISSGASMSSIIADSLSPNSSSNQSHNKINLSKSLHSKLRRERMSYLLKFGEQGSQSGQFAEPSGVAVNSANDDIIIADANNHRIQVFDKWGKLKFSFGDGKLKFPNRVAMSAISGEIIVSERPPVHQIQVYDKNGNFQCKFGSKHLRHPRGLTVDHKNRVIVVECKVMRVFIFNLQGELLHSFDCSTHIQFPNAVAVSSQEEIFISDNRSHCVKVFNFNGEYLRQIGGQGVTNYPIGVILNEQTNQLLVVDNYNNLNVTIFRQDGQLIGAFESSVKHQQCLDVALFTDNSIVVTSKDMQVYVYKLAECNNELRIPSRPQNHHNGSSSNHHRRNQNQTNFNSSSSNHHHHHNNQNNHITKSNNNSNNHN